MGGMKTFLKILLVLVAVIVAIKLLPFTIALACVLGLAVAGMVVLGGSALVLLVCAGLAAAVLLSPIWIPVLALVGIIALCRRLNRPASPTPVV